jgi:3-hydroxybutyryl-CoA dehydrogenase
MSLAERRIAVVGAGLMGHGLAQAFAEADAEVAIHDPVPAALDSVNARVRANLEQLGRDVAAANRISTYENLEAAVSNAEMVVEAGPEDLELKRAIFARLDQSAPASSILATNTSAIPISEVAQRVRGRERVLGTHWWNPPYLVPLVEVVEATDTSPEVVKRTIELLEAAGKTPVHVKRDVPGFIGNRLQHALWREAIALVAAGVCDAQTVDTVVKNSFGLRLPALGPLENADLVGLDLTLAIHEQVLPHIDRAPGPSPYLRHLVAQGRLGMKTGEGFRRWTPTEANAVSERLITHLQAMTASTGEPASAVSISGGGEQ